jgi:hypothetical protein
VRRTPKPVIVDSPPGPIAVFKTPIKIGGQRLIGELSNKLLTIRLTAAELRALRDFAVALGVTVSELVRSALITQIGVDGICRARLVVYVPQPAAVDVEAVRHLKAIAGILIGLLRAPELTTDDVAQQRALIRDVRALVARITQSWSDQATSTTPASTTPTDLGTRLVCARNEPPTAPLLASPPTESPESYTAWMTRAQHELAIVPPFASPKELTTESASAWRDQARPTPGLLADLATRIASTWQEHARAS